MKTSIDLDSDLMAWVNKMIEKRRFASRTHAVHYALQRLREREKEELHL